MRATPRTRENARRLRREMTLPELVLWRHLRRKALGGLRFRRQHPFGRCVVDFYLPAARLAVEIDGWAHDLGDNPQRDRRRDAWLAGQGVRVLRFAAADVLDDERLEGVLRVIERAARGRMADGPPPSPTATPPPHAGEERGGPPPSAARTPRPQAGEERVALVAPPPFTGEGASGASRRGPVRRSSG